MGIKLNAKILIAGLGCSQAVAAAWLDPMQTAVDKFGISESREGLASFLANVGVESNGLTALVENLNYSAQGLANTFPSRYAVDPHTALKIPNALANQIARNPKLIANTTYANRLGNGDVSSGDGWKYRGEGPIQLTGKSNIQAFFEAAGLPLDTDPETLQKPENGALSAAYFFTQRSNAFKAAAAGDFDGSVKAVNGALPCPANQGGRRLALYEAALEVIPEPTPAKAPAPVKQTAAPAAPKNPETETKAHDAPAKAPATPDPAKETQDQKKD